MMQKGFWYFLMTGAIVLYVAVGLLGFYIFPHSWPKAIIGVLFLVVLHLSEVPHVGKVLAGRGFSNGRIIVKTLLFGFTWWVPVKKGILEK